MDFGFFALCVASAYGSGFTNTNHIENVNHHPEMLLEDVNSGFEGLLKMTKRDFVVAKRLEDGKTRTRG